MMMVVRGQEAIACGAWVLFFFPAAPQLVVALGVGGGRGCSGSGGG
jgi:hypothetical protein